MALKSRKINKKRGTRTCGYGGAQKHRGAGSRGGRGNAGSGKHKQKKALMEGRVFGKVGFKRHPSLRTIVKTINLIDIDKQIGKWVDEGKAKKSGSSFSVDLTELGYDKVLGKGKLTHKVDIKAGSFSASAKKKIEESGGKANGVDIV